MTAPETIHPALVRLTHWVNAAAVMIMIVSGWAIHNAHPTLPFQIPFTAGLGFIGGLRWHFAAMWVMTINFVILLVNGLASGRYSRKLRPISRDGMLETLRAALRGRLSHDDISAYNDVQKLLYVGVLAAIALAVLTGLSIWKPVQFWPLTALFGDFDTARLLHFSAMVAIVLFLVAHVTMALLSPRTLLAMIRGR